MVYNSLTYILLLLNFPVYSQCFKEQSHLNTASLFGNWYISEIYKVDLISIRDTNYITYSSAYAQNIKRIKHRVYDIHEEDVYCFKKRRGIFFSGGRSTKFFYKILDSDSLELYFPYGLFLKNIDSSQMLLEAPVVEFTEQIQIIPSGYKGFRILYNSSCCMIFGSIIDMELVVLLKVGVKEGENELQRNNKPGPIWPFSFYIVPYIKKFMAIYNLA
jgi:hypothetical protein